MFLFSTEFEVYHVPIGFDLDKWAVTDEKCIVLSSFMQEKDVLAIILDNLLLLKQKYTLIICKQQVFLDLYTCLLNLNTFIWFPKIYKDKDIDRQTRYLNLYY